MYLQANSEAIKSTFLEEYHGLTIEYDYCAKQTLIDFNGYKLPNIRFYLVKDDVIKTNAILDSIDFDIYNIGSVYLLVYSISKSTRSAVMPNTKEIPVKDAAKPRKILMLCDAIGIYRSKKMYK